MRRATSRASLDPNQSRTDWSAGVDVVVWLLAAWLLAVVS
jgi:hypothetical protein